MATNNQRLSNLEVHVSEQTNTIQQLQNQLHESVTSLKQGFKEKLEQMMRGFEALLAVRSSPSDPTQLGTSGAHSDSILGPFDVGTKAYKPDSIFKTIKFDFPKFRGENPRSWIRKCNKLFSHHVVPENQKLYLATLSLEGEAESWYSGFVHEGQDLSWDSFIEEIIARFSPETHVNPIGELKKLQQTGTVDEYRKQFEELKDWALARNPTLNEEFFMDCFLGGLREEIQLGIQELKAASLKELIRLARVEEAKLEAWLKRSRLVNKGVGIGSFQKTGTVLQPKITATPSLETRTLPIKGLTRDQIAEKRKKGLCFSCDEPCRACV